MRGLGHQNQLSGEVTAAISMSLERERLNNSWLIFCSILVARTAPAISDWGMEKADFPRTLAELERRLN